MRLRTSYVAALTATALAAAACGSSTSSSSSGTAGGTSGQAKASNLKFAYVPVVIANPIIKAMADGMKEQAESLGMNYQQYGGAFDPQVQIQAVKAAVDQKVNALAIYPIEQKTIQPALDQVRQAKIPLILQGNPDVKPYLTDTETDDVAGAYQVTQVLTQALKAAGKPCNVGMILGPPGIPLDDHRKEGMTQALKAAGCTILDQQTDEKDTAEGSRPFAQAWATKFGSKMTGIAAYNDPSALGAISAYTPSFHPLITGSNGDAEGIAAVKAGRMLATSAEPAVEIGNTIAYVAYLANTKPNVKIPQTLWFKYELVTQKNIGTYVPIADRLKQPMKISWAKDPATGRYYVTAK